MGLKILYRVIGSIIVFIMGSYKKGSVSDDPAFFANIFCCGTFSAQCKRS